METTNAIWRVLLLLALIACACRSSTAAINAPSAIKQIIQIQKEETKSCERLLARAAPIAQEAYGDKEWGDVQKALKSAGLSPSGVADGAGYVGYTEYTCVVVPRAFVIKGGVLMDLYLRFDVASGRSEPTYAVPPIHTVTRTTLGLSTTPMTDLEQVRKEKWFGPDSIIPDAVVRLAGARRPPRLSNTGIDRHLP